MYYLIKNAGKSYFLLSYLNDRIVIAGNIEVIYSYLINRNILKADLLLS